MHRPDSAEPPPRTALPDPGSNAAPPLRLFDAAATRERLPFERLVPALRSMFDAGCEVPSRQVLEVAGRFTSLVMTAWTTRYYLVKTINIAPGNAALGLPGLHACVLLHDAATGRPLALIDGDELTARRTAAASALAASFLVRPQARQLLVVGAGRVARLLPLAYRAVRPIERFGVWARSAARAEVLAAAWRADGLDAEAVTDLEAGVRAADVVCCATLATAPLVHGRWLRPQAHLDLIGGFTPAMREADDACFADAALFVDTEEALAKSGDLLGPLARGVIRAEDLRGTLGALCGGQAEGWRAGDGRTVFKSVGTALEDLAAAILVDQADAG